MSRILALDFGNKRCGLAVTDPLQIIATPLDTVPTASLMEFLKQYCSREQVSRLVIGYPVNLDGGLNELETGIQAFIVDLKKVLPELGIERMDERFTSSMAQQVILNSGIGKMERRNKSLVDKVSATLILQSYLEQNPR